MRSHRVILCTGGLLWFVACSVPVATDLGTADMAVSDRTDTPRTEDMFTSVVFPEMGVGVVDATVPTPCDPNPCTADELCMPEGDMARCAPRTARRHTPLP